jgi:outer membrane protein assembly factor BamB
MTFALCSTVSLAGDWPQFMGPAGTGVSTEKGFPRAFPAEGPKVLWTVPLGPGYGGAAIREGKVYVLDRVEKQKDVLRCLELNTGKEAWTFEYDAPGDIDHEGSRSTPAVTDKYAFTIGPFGDFHCISLSTHKSVWKKNLIKDYGAKLPRWSVAQSPIIYKDAVIAAPQGPEAGIAAYDQATGKELWRSDPLGAMAYSSPLRISLEGVEQFVIVNPEGVTSINAGDGKTLWKYAHPCKIPIPNVTAMGGGKFFVTGAYMAGSAIIQVSGKDGQWSVKELAKHNQIGGHCHPAFLVKDHLYLLCNVNERADGMVCFDSELKVVWQTKNSPNLDKGGSLLTGDGLLYVMDGRTGELHIVEPSPTEFKSLSKAKLLEGREIWGPLALSAGKLVIRDQKQMKCVDLRAK